MVPINQGFKPAWIAACKANKLADKSRNSSRRLHSRSGPVGHRCMVALRRPEFHQKMPTSSKDPRAPLLAINVLSLTSHLSSSVTLRLQNLQDPLSRDKLTLIAAAGCGAFIGSSFASRAPAAVAIMIMGAAQAAMGYMILLRQAHVFDVPDAAEPAGGGTGPHLSRAALGSFGVLTSIGAGGTLIAPYLTLKGIQHRQAVSLAAWLSVLIGGTALVVYAAATTAASVDGAVGPCRAGPDRIVGSA